MSEDMWGSIAVLVLIVPVFFLCVGAALFMGCALMMRWKIKDVLKRKPMGTGSRLGDGRCL